MKTFLKSEHQIWLASEYTIDVIQRLERIKTNTLNYAAALADRTDKDPQEVHKFLVKANALNSIIDILKNGGFTDSTQLI